MGRFLSGASAAAMGAAAGGYLLPGQLPAFGSGRYLVVPSSQNWTVPANVFQVRARVLGGGAGTTAGGSSSFGSYCSATGGKPASGAVPGDGGVGIGGDFQAKGGVGGAGFRGGGGASGSELGDGGAGGAGGAVSGGGGGGVGGKIGGAGLSTADRQGGGGASAFGHGASPDNVTSSSPGRGAPDLSGALFASYHNVSIAHLPHGLSGFTGGGGSSISRDGGHGGGGAGGAGGGADSISGKGGWGGACGGGGGAGGTSNEGGSGGFCWQAWAVGPANIVYGNEQRIGGGLGGTSARAGAGGGGYARGVFAVEPGQVIPLTVAQQSATYQAGVSGGLIVLEF